MQLVFGQVALLVVTVMIIPHMLLPAIAMIILALPFKAIYATSIKNLRKLRTESKLLLLRHPSSSNAHLHNHYHHH